MPSRNKMTISIAGLFECNIDDMSDFSKKIASQNGVLLFDFTRIYTVSGPVYFVSVSNRLVRESFQMKEESGEWSITRTAGVQDWLLQLEPELNKTIVENLSAKGV